MYSILENLLLESKRTSSINRKNAVMKHVDHFLENNKVVTANTKDTLKHDDIIVSLVGKFVTYFVSHAHLNIGSGNHLVAPSIVVLYLNV